MASCENGYEDDRFENAVGQNFHCAICLNVFEDPVMCQRNQHCFCRPCITRHLENSHTCPSCKDELTLETLIQAPRIFLSCWSELKIRCDYFKRGCREFVQLGDLETHVNDCGFTPMLCSNEGCLVEISRRDRIHHESEVCEFRKVKCHNCSEIRKEMEGVKMNLIAVTKQVEEIKNSTAVTDQVKEIKVSLKGITDNVEEMKNSIAVTDQVKEIKVNLKAVTNEVKEIKINLTGVNNEMKETKKDLTEIKGQLKTLPDQIERSIHTAQEMIKRTTAGAVNETESVVIVGGMGNRQLNSVEMFRWSERTWTPLRPMKICREAASSFVYENQIIVAGGHTEPSTNMEKMDINYPVMSSAQWLDFPAKLPTKLFGHNNVVHNERLIVTGGLAIDTFEFSDNIHEVLLSPPYTSKFLSRMPEERMYHGVEIFDDKILILGGSTSGSGVGNLNSVLAYDISKNECKQMTSLPVAVSEMATVRWGNNAIVIGGVDKHDNALNTVVIYNVQTGKSHMLPDMKFNRKGCAAVVSQNTIVVMGGRDEQNKIHNSVECFSFDSYLWEDLPPMKEARARATAVAC